MRNRLLVVDGEPRGLRVLDVSLRGAGFDVETATDGLQAWAILEKALPDLVLCDTDVGGLNGFELCARLRHSHAGAHLPFLMLSASKSREHKIRSLEAGADDFLIKPAYINEVLARVRALLQRRDREALGAADGAVDAAAPLGGSGRIGTAPFAGDLAEISVVDLVQLIEGNGRSGIVHLRGPGDAVAFLYFRGGQVVDAEAGRLSGLDALSRLFSWTTGTFAVEWKNVRRRDAIDRSSSDLVLEGMQRLDAWNELRAQLGDPNAVFEVDYHLLAERLAEIPDEVNGILRLCDGVRTVMQVVEDSTMPDAEALTAILRLRAEGIVYDQAATRGEASTSSGRLGGWPGATPSPFSASGSGSHPRSGPATEAVEQSFAARMDADAHGMAPPPEPPRRTAPGLGQRTPLPQEQGDAVPALRPEQTTRQSNVIRFPAPEPTSQPDLEGPRTPHLKPTLVGFEPAAQAPDSPPDVTGAGSAPVGVDPSLTLPLGLAQQAALARDQLLRELATADSVDPAEVAQMVEATAPSGPAPLADTHRGFGPVPSGPGGDPPAAPAVLEAAEPDRAIVPEAALASGSVRSAAGSPRRALEEGSGDHLKPPPADATARVSFADREISRRDALDELGMPSRWRGLRLLVGALVVGALAAVGVGKFLASRPDGAGEGSQRREAAVATPVPSPISAPPAAAVVVPRAVPAAEEPRAAAPPPVTPPPVELPPAAVAPNPAKPAAAPAREVPVPEESPAAPSGHAPEAAPSAPAADPAGPAKPAASPGPAHQLADCRAAFAKSRWRDALAACGAAAAANPRSAEALTMLAHTELNRGRLERANELAAKAVTLDPNVADAYVIIGGVHQDSGQNKEAKAAYRRYLELAPRGRYADELRSIVNGL